MELAVVAAEAMLPHQLTRLNLRPTRGDRSCNQNRRQQYPSHSHTGVKFHHAVKTPTHKLPIETREEAISWVTRKICTSRSYAIGDDCRTCIV